MLEQKDKALYCSPPWCDYEWMKWSQTYLPSSAFFPSVSILSLHHQWKLDWLTLHKPKAQRYEQYAADHSRRNMEVNNNFFSILGLNTSRHDERTATQKRALLSTCNHAATSFLWYDSLSCRESVIISNVNKPGLHSNSSIDMSIEHWDQTMLLFRLLL